MPAEHTDSATLDQPDDFDLQLIDELICPRRDGESGLVDEVLSPLTRLWILRILVPLGGQRRFVRGSDFANDDLAVSLGFVEEAEADRDNFDAKAINTRLQQLHSEAEREARACPPTHSPTLETNLDRFQELLHFSASERAVLRFALSLHTESMLDDTADLIGRCSLTKFYQALAGILGLTESAVRRATSSESVLARSGLLLVDTLQNGLRHKFIFVSDKLPNRMLQQSGGALELLKGVVNQCPSAELVRADYAHLEADLAVIGPYLKIARDQHRKGVNILFYGPPGTGKTQLARLIADELEVPLFEVTNEDNDGDPSSGTQRLNAFRMAQTLFRERPALVVFDEVEDLFGSPRTPARSGRSSNEPSKSWINHILENNAAPTFWISNVITEIDPAYVRRFDYVLRVGQPPREAREALLVRTCGDLLPPVTLRRLSAHPQLAPALITRAAQVLGDIQATRSKETYQTDLVRMIDHTLRAQGHSPISETLESPLPPFYDPRFINTAEDPEKILEGIRRTGSARLCLFGPPGTGKTAFGRYIAEKLGRRLHLVRTSDILGPYVGMTEANLAEAFAQARSSKSVLLIDEVDSFLQNRSHARHGWEITAVNEMLTQMENFPGVFIASTNLMDDLDPAAMRRLDLKLKFLSLRPDQAAELLSKHLNAADLPPAKPEDIRELSRLHLLTPGDFAAVDRRHRFYALTDAAAFVRALAAECAQKTPHNRGSIGFGLPAAESLHGTKQRSPHE